MPIALNGPVIGAVLLRRKWTIGFAAVIASFLTFLVAEALPRTYSAEGGLVVDNQQLNIPEMGTLTNSVGVASGDAVATASDVLRSRGTLASVVHDLDLGNVANLSPHWRLPSMLAAFPGPVTQVSGAWHALMGTLPQIAPDQPVSPTDATANADEEALQYLEKHVKVLENEHSNLLVVRFDAGSPDVASSAINALMRNYIAADVAARQTQMRQANDWLTQRARDLRTEVDADDLKIGKFLQDHQIGQLQGGTVAAVQLSGTRDRLAAARDSLARLQASLDVATHSSAPGGASATQQVLASPVIQALRQREADLLQRLAGLPQNHPERAKLEDEARSVRGQLASGTDKIIAALTRDTEAARSNVLQLEQTADKAETDARSASVSRADYEQLLHDADAKRQIYNSFLARADQTRLASLQLPAARVQFEAAAPRQPDHVSRILLVLLGFVAGGLIAAGAVVLNTMLRGKVRSTWDIALASGVPVLGALPEIKLLGGRANKDAGLLRSARTQPAVDETLRAVWLALRSMTPQGACATVVVTSSEVGEGKTEIASALARTVASDGFRVLLIDADLRRRGLSSTLRVQPGCNIETVLTGAVALEDALLSDPATGLHCLAGDRVIANPMRILNSKEFKDLMIQMQSQYDFVILDAPPVMRVADAVLLSELTLFTLFAVGHGRVSSEILAQAISRFPNDRRSKIVTLQTRVPGRQMNKNDSYGGYGTVVPDTALTDRGSGPGPRHVTLGGSNHRGMVRLD